MVECNLAKVDVASSNLVSRSLLVHKPSSSIRGVTTGLRPARQRRISSPALWSDLRSSPIDSTRGADPSALPGSGIPASNLVSRSLLVHKPSSSIRGVTTGLRPARQRRISSPAPIFLSESAQLDQTPTGLFLFAREGVSAGCILDHPPP